MLLTRARDAWQAWKSRPAEFSFARHGKTRQRRPSEVALPGNTLRLLSFNVQAGIASQRFGDYLTGSWKHLVAHPQSADNIDRIADLVSNFDLVALQEVDGGSLRSGNINQLVHMATRAEFPFWHQQLNRNLGRLGQFSNGLLSRLTPYHIEDHRLPGLPGRGAIIAHYGHPDNPLIMVGAHLALGEKYRNTQLAYLCEQLQDYRHLIIMGDFNCRLEHLQRSPLAELGLVFPEQSLLTYPSWAPDRHIDHILLSPSLTMSNQRVLTDCRLSDHLPLAMDIQLPEDVLEAASHAPLALTWQESR